MRSPWLRRTALVLALVSLGGCNARKVAYGWADRFALGALDDVFQLTPAQKRFLAPRLAAHLAWHRHNELPKYTAVVEWLRARVAGGGTLSATDLAGLGETVVAALGRLADRLAPDAGAFLATVTPPQVAHAAKALAKQTSERFEDLALPEPAWLKKRLKAAKKTLEDWTGSATPVEVATLERFVREGRPVEIAQRERALANQRALMTLLKQNPGQVALADAMRRFLTTGELDPTDADRAEGKRERERATALVSEILGELTPRQRAKLVAELASLRDDFVELATSGKEATPIDATR